jgi:hypothetical protein
LIVDVHYPRRIPLTEPALFHVRDDEAERRAHDHHVQPIAACLEAWFIEMERLGYDWDSPEARVYRGDGDAPSEAELPIGEARRESIRRRMRPVFAGFDPDPLPVSQRRRARTKLQRDAKKYVRDSLGLCQDCGSEPEEFYDPATENETYELMCGHATAVDPNVSVAVCRVGQDIGAAHRRNRASA